MADLQLSCSCGKVKGSANNVKPGCGTRILCYCNDCRNFLKYLKQQEDFIDEFGGTEILHIPLAMMRFDQGTEHLCCLRFSEKGLYRWFTSCCNTPIGCMVSSLSFVGVCRSFIASDQDIDTKIGPVAGSVYTQFALKPLPPQARAGKSKYGMLFHILKKILLWKVQGKGSPNPFVDQQGKLLAKPCIIDFKG